MYMSIYTVITIIPLGLISDQESEHENRTQKWKFCASQFLRSPILEKLIVLLIGIIQLIWCVVIESGTFCLKQYNQRVHEGKSGNQWTGLILAFGSSILGIDTPLSILLTGRWPSCKGYRHTNGLTVKNTTNLTRFYTFMWVNKKNSF